MPEPPVAARDHRPESPVTGNLRRSVFFLALPALAEQLLNYCVSLFDTWLAGQVSTAAHEPGIYTTTVGIAAYISWLASLIFLLVGTGTTALVSRAAGAGDIAGANRFACRSMGLASGLGLGVFLLLTLLAPWFAGLQRLSGESFRVAVSYLRTDAWGMLFFGFCLIGAAALRGVGDMRTPMWILGFVNLLNIVASSVLVFGLGPIAPWGIDGVVAGTVVARISGGLLMLAVLARGAGGLRLQRELVWPHGEDVRRIVRIGAPAALDGVLMWSGQWLFLMIISRLGAAGMGKAYTAAHMIGMEAEALTYLPATAWGHAAASLIGRRLGARDPRGARRVGNEAARQALFFALVGGLVYYFGADLIYAVMTREPEVRAIGAPALRFLSWYQIPLAAMVVYIHALRGSGDTRPVLVLNLAGFYLVRLPLAALLGIEFEFGLIGVWSAMCVDVTLRAILATVYFSRGRWTNIHV